MNYVTIDFETANSTRGSVCSIGLVEVNNNEIVNTYNYLINPEEPFDYFNTLTHGITSEMVEDKPTFPQVWDNIKSIIESKLVIAHNASFDISVLRNVLDKYGLAYPSFNYSCTRILSKKTWNNLVNYKLNTISKYLNIEFKHHDALEDAIACSKIMTNIIKTNNIDNIQELHDKLQVKIGKIFDGGYAPTQVKSSSHKINVNEISPETSEFDESNAFYDKMVVFTGTLSSMPRKDAMQMVVNVGGKCNNGVTKATNYLVMGIQDYSKFTDGEKSSKLKKAEELISKGADLEIIGEDEFLQLL